jgi:putative glutamine amidotransferase
MDLPLVRQGTLWQRIPCMPSARPLVGVISDRRTLGEHPFQVQGEKYLRAVAEGAGGCPVGIPALDGDFDVGGILEHLSGLLLPGSPSNVEPHRYGGPASRPGTRHDPARDNAVFRLLPACIEAGLPVLAICRGFQELNVAFGGSLHQEVHGVPGLNDHREDKTAPLEVQYGPAHDVSFTPGGLLNRLTGRTAARVNSVHSQGVERLGEGLRVEAVAPDGLIEAVSVPGARGFVLGVQWHPEWRVLEDPVSRAIFAAFGEACRTWRGLPGRLKAGGQS